MFTDRQVSRLEKDLRHDDSKVRAQGLRRIARLPRDALLAYVIERPWVPLVLGTLLALEAGEAVATDNLEEVALARVAAALSGRSVARRRAAHKALIHGNVSLASILPALERCTRDRRRDVRRRAADVLSWGAPGQTVPTADVSLVEQQLRDPVLRELGFSSAAGMVRRLLEALAAAGAHAGTRQSLAWAVHACSHSSDVSSRIPAAAVAADNWVCGLHDPAFQAPTDVRVQRQQAVVAHVRTLSYGTR
jgi:hypothetical protein